MLVIFWREKAFSKKIFLMKILQFRGGRAIVQLV